MMRLGTIVIRGAFILIRSGVNSSDWAVRPEVDCRYVTGAALPARRPLVRDQPPSKWSDLRYVFDIKEDCNGKEALQARRDRREAAPGRCSGLAGPGHDGGDPADRCERGDLLSL